MTAAEFFDWSARQPEGRYELVRGEPVAMSPERIRHGLAKGAAYRALEGAVVRSGLQCTVVVDSAAIVIDDKTARVPDVTVQCGPIADLDAQYYEAPLIVVEVISPSSIRVDTEDKFEEYFSVASIQHYLVVKPEKRIVIHHARGQAGEIRTRILGSGEIELAPPGLSVKVEDLFGPAQIP